MTRKLAVDPLAQSEIDEAVRWYGYQGEGHGAVLASEIRRALSLIESLPEHGSPYKGDARIRYVPLRRFPYRVVYLVDDDSFEVVALAHNSRRPDYWRDRL